ncbi:hypothetical protein [Ruegeria arenilitoris]|uniref:hypothetical protein n=1 Tax=Ruegeria arenilitoris TaxID=1173585 RepID=UPI00147A19B9|nr:hypothetical protein [Ruegeria arenilitoris]
MPSVNQYWPIYRRLEQSVDNLTHSIHVCDDQLDVYSSEIADLIIRIGAEIEAISKSIYRRDFDEHVAANSKFDDVAIKRFVRDWKLDKKVAILSHPNCFCSEKLYLPFVKDTIRTGKQTKTFSWNNAYQNLKHNREEAFHFASLRHLLAGMAALYILNLYHRDEVIDLEDDHSAVRLDPGQGSELFSVQFSTAAYWDGSHVRQPKEDFSQSVYFIDQEPEYAEQMREALDKFNEAYQKEIMTSPEVLEAMRLFTPEKAKNPNWLRESISNKTYMACAQRAQRIAPMPKLTAKYQAYINRHQVLDTPSPG